VFLLKSDVTPREKSVSATSPELDADDAPVAAKPPFIHRIRIRNYKSIEFCDVTLEPLTVLVGRNASGKSNFLDALGFLSDVMEFGIEKAISIHGGASAILNRRSKFNRVDFLVDFGSNDSQQSRFATYAFELSIQRDTGKVTVEKDEFTNLSTSPIRALRHEKPQETNETIGLLLKRQFDYLNKNDANFQYYGWAIELSRKLSRSKVYHFSHSKIRMPQPKAENHLVDRDGGNLSNVCATLFARDPWIHQRIQQYLNSIVPEVEKFDVAELGDYRTIRFQCENIENPFYAASMSDGTLLAVATLTAFAQTDSNGDSPGFIAIEEPETSLHPAAMRALVAAFDEATLSTQVILTTHSSELLDAKEIRPEMIRVVENRDGATILTPLDGASVEIIREGFYTLGELERIRQLGINEHDWIRQKDLCRNGAHHP
jgi:predicted ATPase